jgi:thiol peroxidase
MSQVTLKGNPFNTVGDLPKVGTTAPDFKLTKIDLSYTE